MPIAKTKLFVLFTTCATLAAMGESALLGVSARLQLESADADITPTIFYPGWISRTPEGGWKPEKDNRRHWHILDHSSKKSTINGYSEYLRVGEHTLNIAYAWKKLSSVKLIGACASVRLPVKSYGGGSILANGKAIKLPADWEKQATLWDGSATNLVFRNANGRECFQLNLPEPGYPCHLQDNRQWNGQDFSLRIQFYRVKDAPPNHEILTSFQLVTPDPLEFSTQPHTILAGNDWIKMSSDWHILPNSALDFSKFRGTDAPAGRHGYPVCRNGHFEFERLPGRPQRFYGCNVVSSANFPDAQAAEEFAAAFARIGYNAMRFHHHDNGFSAGPGGKLDEENMRKFDRLYAACRAQGIYMTTDLYVSRRPLWRDLGIDKNGRCTEIGYYKALVHFNEKAFNDLIDYSRAFLSHVNPHTGLSYAEDPALGWLSLVNEGDLGGGCAGGIDALLDIPGCATAWQEFRLQLIQKDPSFADIPSSIPKNLWKSKDNRLEIAFHRFLAEREATFAKRVKRFLRDEMKCRALVTDMNLGFDTALYELVRHDEYDYVDNHFYVDHPRFLEKRWRLPSSCPNGNPLLGRSRGARNIFSSRIFGMPFTVSEYNYSGPGRFRGMGGITTAALAALQDWDGLWRFAWSHSLDGMQGVKPMTYFDMAGDPLSLASERASVCLFLRRDLAPLKEHYALVLPPAKIRAQHEGQAFDRVPWNWCAWYAKSGSYIGDAAPQGWRSAGTFPEFVDKSDEEIAADLKGLPCGGGALDVTPDGRFLLRTPCTAGGFAETGSIDAGTFHARLENAAATVWASSLDSQPIRESSRLLVSHLTDVQNSGIQYADRTLRVLMNWGTLPHLMRKGKAHISITASTGNWKLYALEANGARRGEIPFTFENGTLSFTADTARDPENATYLYELVKE